MKRFFRAIKFLIFIIVLIGGAYFYGTYVEPNQLVTHEYNIKNKDIPNNFDGFKIVHLSDIHYGFNFDISRLKELVEKINDLEPDIVVITGDLLDKKATMNSDVALEISSTLLEIEASSGKYAISGEDDSKFDEWENIINDGGFTNLNNDYDTIYNNGYAFILIAGVSSFSDKETIVNKNQKTENFFNSFEKNGPVYSILLMHEPDYIDELENNFYDLVLAGHSHAGQIKIPYFGTILKYKGAKTYDDGYYKVGSCTLYVSNGIGVTDFNFRLFNTPSINVYRLTK